MRRLLFSLTLAVAAGAAEAIAPYARFDEGLIGRIRPDGWIGEFCRRQKVVADESWLKAVQKYEKDVLLKR